MAGKYDDETSPQPVIGGGNSAAESADDAVSNGQTQSGTLSNRLHREEGFEQPRKHLRRNAATIFRDGDLDLLFACSCAQGNAPLGNGIAHRSVAGIEQ
jgi:hypothetical protein